MNTAIDTRGLSCPQPVLMVLDRMKKIRGDELIVFVNTAAARENVTRAAAGEGWTVRDLTEQGEEYRLTLVRS